MSLARRKTRAFNSEYDWDYSHGFMFVSHPACPGCSGCSGSLNEALLHLHDAIVEKGFDAKPEVQPLLLGTTTLKLVSDPELWAGRDN